MLSLCTVALLGLAGCGSAGGDGSAALAPRSISVSYVDSDSTPAVAVAVTHPQPLVSVELVAPDGRSVAAPQIERDPPRGTSGSGLTPSVGVGVFGGSGGGMGTGLSLGFPLGGSVSPPSPAGQGARARVVIPDPAEYRRDWQRYVVWLRFGAAPDPVTVADLPAPQPR
jgi:hypothetical protein